MKNLIKAFMASPGPDTKKKAFVLSFKGFCMGCVDLIPGVSGGTVAFLVGIYPQLLAAIRSFDLSFIKRFFTGKFCEALEGFHLRFLLVMVSGQLTALFGFARFIDYLLTHYTLQVYGVFFGFLVGSVYILGRGVKWNPLCVVLFAAGAVLGWLIVGLVPVTTPFTLPFIFISGVISISVMILPALSGSFVLFVLGKYEFLIKVLKSPFAMNEIMGVNNIIIIGVFVCGIIVGLAASSRYLRWLLARAYNLTLVSLVGLVAGSVRRLWPWKGDIVTSIIDGKEHVVSQSNVLPPTFDKDFYIVAGLIIAGAVFVIVLEAIALRKSREEAKYG